MIAAIGTTSTVTNSTHDGVAPVTLASYPWLQGRVPDGYWASLANRQLYLRWLGLQCGFEKPEDWYRVRQSHFKKNYGGGLLANSFGYSLQNAVAELFPDFNFLPWRFGGVPQRFWKDAANRHRYMCWLGVQLGYANADDWNRVTKSQFYKRSGGGLLANYYGDSPQRAVDEFLSYEERSPIDRRAEPYVQSSRTSNGQSRLPANTI